MTGARRNARGFSLVEMLIGLCVMSLAGTALTSLMIHNSRINRTQQTYADVQNSARNSMELITSRLRSAGWDPLNKDIPVVATDPDLADAVSQIEIFADHDEDGFTTSDGEQVLIRHNGDRIEWRVSPSSSFSLVASDISNDADEDGTPEPMFVPDDATNPTAVLVQVTARSSVPDPATGRYIRYTLTNEVALEEEAMNSTPGSRERGSALVMAVMFMSLLTALGIALLFLSQMNLEMNRTMLNTKQSFYMAESGVERGRRTLFELNPGSDDFGPRLLASAGSNGVLDFNPAAIQAVYGSDGEFTGFTGYGDDAPLVVASPAGDGYYTAFLMNDPLDGRAALADSNARVIVTGVGVGPNHSFKVVEAIIEPDINLPPLPASVITLLGSSPTFSGGASGSEKYRGDDCHFLGGGDPALDLPIVGVMTDDAETAVEAGMAGDPLKYSSGSYHGDDTAVNLNDGTDPLLSGTGLGTLDANWQNCAYLQELLLELKKHSTKQCTGACTLGATTKDDVTFIDGDLVVGPGQHVTGMLVVTGSLMIDGSSSFAGVMLVIGEGALLRNGGGSGVLSGSTIVADIAGANGVYGDADDCQPVPPSTDPFGESTYTVNGGGNTDVDYCTRFLYTQPRSYVVSDFRQF